MTADRLRLAQDLVELRRHDEAARVARDILAVEPEHVGAMKVLARASLARPGREGSQAALEVLERAASVAPDDADVLYLFAFTWSRLRRPRKAERYVAAALQRAPAYVPALWLLCQLQMQRKKRAAAFASLRAVADHSRDAAFVHEAMGRVALWAGQRRLAGEHVRRALAQRPDDPDLLRLLAKAERGRDVREPAVTDPLLRALRVAPAHAGAAEDLRRAAAGRMVTVSGVGAVAYVVLAVAVEAALGVSSRLPVLVGDGLLLLVAFRLIRTRVRYELPPEALTLVDLSRPVALWPFAAAFVLGFAGAPTNGTRWFALMGALLASRGAARSPSLRTNRSLRNRAGIVLESFAGFGLLVAGAAVGWHLTSTGRRAALVAAAALALAGLGAAAYRARHPKEVPVLVSRRSLPPARARVTLVAAFLPWWLLLGALATPFLLLLWPLLAAARLRGSRLGQGQIAALAGGSVLLDGVIAAGLVVGLGGRSHARAAIVVLVIAAIVGLTFAARVRAEAVPDWMRLDGAAASRPEGRGA